MGGVARSTWQRQPATDDPHLQRPSLLAYPLDVKVQRLLGVRDGFVKILTLGVEPRQLRRVRVVATVRVWLEDELHVACGLHALTLTPPALEGGCAHRQRRCEPATSPPHPLSPEVLARR